MTTTDFCASLNPVTGEELERFAYHEPEDLERLLSVARRGYAEWRLASIDNRTAALSRLAAILRQRSQSLARTITLEMGKPIREARAEVEKCAVLCDWYAANAAELLADEAVDLGSSASGYISHLPIGTVLAVMPWNFPLWQVMRAAVPILAVGNGILLKHADNVQGSARGLADAFRAADFPDGVFAVANARRRDIPSIIADDRIAAVTVTAGVGAGAAIAAEAGRNLKKSVLELGGVDPFIILADADLGKAVPAAIKARFQNCGQVCIAAKRFIVEEPLVKAFTERFAAAAAALKVGDPLAEDTDIGPMARRRLRAELHTQVRASIDAGARLLLGGDPADGPGAFYPPTVLGAVTPEMATFDEETFGPAASITTARDADEAIRLANLSRYGLSSALWTDDTANARALARRLETGGVFINGVSASDPRIPIGGVKNSGYGRELSYFGLREFSNAQIVWQSHESLGVTAKTAG